MNSTTLPASRRRVAARLAIGAALAGAVVLAAPLAASAHVHVTPEDAAADAATNITFSFSHGCEDSPTTALVVDIPEGVTNVVPVVQAGWTIERTLADNGTVSRVSYRADAPVENGLKGEVSMDLRFDAALADTAVPFPITQECVSGSTAWTEVAAEGEEEPESPAPVVQVGAVAAEGEEHGHGGDASAETAAESPADTSDSGDVTALWLGGAGLGLGVVAVILAVTALVRRRA
jgi:periplasmic copper chaperone A